MVQCPSLLFECRKQERQLSFYSSASFLYEVTISAQLKYTNVDHPHVCKTLLLQELCCFHCPGSVVAVHVYRSKEGRELIFIFDFFGR